MKKSIVVLSFALGAALSLAACGKHDADDNSAAAADNVATEVGADDGNGFDGNALAGNGAALGNGDDLLANDTGAPDNAQ